MLESQAAASFGDGETREKRANGGHDEGDPPDVCVEAQFTVSKGLTAMDWYEHPYLAALLRQTTQSRADGTATTYGGFTSIRAGARRILFPEPLSVRERKGVHVPASGPGSLVAIHRVLM